MRPTRHRSVLERALVLALAFACTPLACLATEWYVSPSGASDNAGTQAAPWDITSACLGHSGKVQPGDTIYLMDGTYNYYKPGYEGHNGNIWVKLIGTAEKRIVLRPAVGAHAIINGGVTIGEKENYGHGDVLMPSKYLDIRDIEFCSKGWVNDVISTQSGPWPGDVPSPVGGVNMYVGQGIRIINCIVHGASEGFTSEIEDVDSLVYGCIVYGCGWKAPDRGHGHCVYTQNKDPNKTYSNCIFSTRYPDGQQTMQAYGTGNTFLDHFYIEDNIFMDQGQFLLGGGATFHDAHVNGNVFDTTPVWIGYSLNKARVNGDAVVTKNLVVDADIHFWWIEALEEANNTIIGGKKLIYAPHSPDAIVTPGGSPPAAPTILVKPNAFEPGRGNLVIFNWQSDSKPKVTVNFKGLVGAKRPFRLMDPKDFYGAPVAQGTTDAQGCAAVNAPNKFNVYVVLSGPAKETRPAKATAPATRQATSR